MQMYRYTYDICTCMLVLYRATNGLPELFTNAEAKITLFRERYSILHQVCLMYSL